ncbi:hypothetical protein EO98_11410 [Methanosarcina sp. 2.H.T.1A.6]|uniref:hypothetical protein n=1 Tax=unclassified Methanosarcina TaxID=2644672 RepID=UPI0006228655|nr:MULTISPECIES: hypothetical protein [unclassified Methanosarcina]KKG18800.1 hypothetical protein EO94_12820 [Methanosarcina sp. 2.H.T.1A.3]KKG20566.1 hypothetical protein EO97_17070 [Methanosarcina sp. 2.H.T.1A.15]KKG23653.1 hypothetical protein EO98_11410 [Methanosarcina sp. 2.H.T.1A.6]KKG26953.1 hypothetical protein EO96_13665 [Methanosarcina sp. 2.H.T.1A.8]
MRDFTGDNSAWADFLISKGALILVSVVLFAALFHLVTDFKDLEAQEQLDSLARDFKTEVDEVELRSLQEDFPSKFPGDSQETFDSQGTYYYRFNEKEVFRALPFREDVKVLVSGEYVCLEAEYNERSFRAVRPFACRVLPFNESVLQEKLRTKFGTNGSETSPLTADYKEILTFLQNMGTQEIILDPEESISVKKEHIYINDSDGGFAFGCILVYQ